jgi:MYXO-CTERM domain-containing protein
VPYNGAITTVSNNPLGGRQAFVRASAGFPAFVNATINFGTALANKTVLVRFRIGTDEAVGDLGWTIDDIAFTGITNKPFRTVTNDTATCGLQPPISNAGPDQTVPVSTLVTLDGSASSDPQGAPLTFLWTQLSGTAVTLSSRTVVKPTFTAPAAASTLVFRLHVSNGSTAANDTVTINVVNTTPPDAGVDAPPADAPPDAATPDAAPDAATPDAATPDAATPDAATPDAAVPDAAQPDASNPPPPPPPPTSDGGCCSTGGGSPAQHAPLIVGVLLLLARRRRRRV